MKILDAITWLQGKIAEIDDIATVPENPGGGAFPLAIVHLGPGEVKVGNPAATWYALDAIVIEVHVSNQGMAAAFQLMMVLHPQVLAVITADTTLGGFIQTYGSITYGTPQLSEWDGSPTLMMAYVLNNVKTLNS